MKRAQAIADLGEAAAFEGGLGEVGQDGSLGEAGVEGAAEGGFGLIGVLLGEGDAAKEQVHAAAAAVAGEGTGGVGARGSEHVGEHFALGEAEVGELPVVEGEPFVEGGLLDEGGAFEGTGGLRKMRFAAGRFLV